LEDVIITPVDSSISPVKAKRPSNSRMIKEKLDVNGFERLPRWESALGR
jgi:dTDP-4-dehydrorhamnose reductase